MEPVKLSFLPLALQSDRSSSINNNGKVIVLRLFKIGLFTLEAPTFHEHLYKIWSRKEKERKTLASPAQLLWPIRFTSSRRSTTGPPLGFSLLKRILSSDFLEFLTIPLPSLAPSSPGNIPYNEVLVSFFPSNSLAFDLPNIEYLTSSKHPSGTSGTYERELKVNPIPMN